MVMRVTGIASGMDIESIVTQMMTSRKAPLTKLVQKKQILEWQREDYRTMNSQLLDFRNYKLFEFKKDSTFSAKQASVTGADDVISVKPSTSAVNGPIYVQVKSLATAASAVSDLSTELPSGYVPGTSLNTYFEDLEAEGETGSKKVAIKINDSTLEFSFDPEYESMEALIYKINTHADSPVSAFFDATSRKISLISKTEGSLSEDGAQPFEIEDIKGNIGATLFSGMSQTDGTNAEVTINGIDTIQKSNTFTVNGTEITLKGVSPKDGENYIQSTINVTTDTSTILESIKTFISDYNNVLSSIYDKINETYYRDYQPLSSEEKEAMSEKEIELWEAKAKSGHLKNDGILSRTYYDMRSIIASQVDTGSSIYKTLSSIGIETGSYEENGKLYLKDEEKLLKALQEDPEAVKALFTADGDGSGDQSKIGLAERLYTTAYSAISDISDKAGTSKYSTSETFKYMEDSLMGKNLTSLSKQIDNWTQRLQDIEDRYYAQFTAMEKAINTYNNQSAYLTNLFSTS